MEIRVEGGREREIWAEYSVEDDGFRSANGRDKGSRKRREGGRESVEMQ